MQLLMGHIRNRDDMGDMILQEIDYTQMIAGVDNPVLDERQKTPF